MKRLFLQIFAWLENNALWAGCLLIAAVIGCMLIWRRHRKD